MFPQYRLSSLRVTFMLTVLLCASPSPLDAQAPPKERLNVIFVVVDAMRTDALGAYGCQEPTTPFVDQFAAENWLFTQAFSASNATKPSMASLWTGTYPSVHGAIKRDDKLDNGATTISELLGAAGYNTGLFSGNPWLSEEFGFEQGFHKAEQTTYASDLGRNLDGNDINTRFLRWVESGLKSPFFAHLHYMDCHEPYCPSEEKAKVFMKTPGQEVYVNGPILSTMTTQDVAHMRERYLSGARAFDDVFKNLVAALKQRNLWDKTILFLMADHGEEFGDHGGLGHGTTLYNELLRVPLIVHYPGQAARRIDWPVSLLDVMPIVCQVAGLTPPPGIRGVNWLDNARNGTAPAERNIFARACSLGDDSYVNAVIWKGMKYIFNETKQTEELYDLSRDPKEKNPLKDGYQDLIIEAKKLIQEQIDLGKQSGAPKPTANISPKNMDLLKGIGYLR